MNRKVCHITSAHNRYDVRILQKECTSLAKSGFDVTLLVNDNEPNEIVNNVKIASTKHKPQNRIARIIYSTKNLYKMAIEINADVYHFHDPELLPVGNKLKRKGKKVIFDSHENYALQIKEKYYIPPILRKLISFLYYEYETYAVRKLDSVIVPCTFNHINHFNNRAKRTVFINNVPIMNELFDGYCTGSAKKKRTICYVGALAYNRGITHLVKAAYKADANLVLVGNFSPKEYYTEIQRMKEFSIVDYRGYVDRDTIVEIFKDCVIGICTVLNVGQYDKGDNLLTKVYEYMAMGLPVIISDYPYAREVLKEYEFGIAVDPENIDEIADKISYLVDNPEIAKKMGHEGRRAVKEKFNWCIEEKKLLDLYMNI